MNIKQDFKTDLVALSHPLVLASILILLINDHVLKVYAPSLLTGKISDFAGLIFFPILLSAILNLIFKPLNPQPRQIALVSFGFTAIWFALIKTIPFFTNLTESVFSVQIIRDQSDLIALIMLLPAWKLRTSIESQKEVKVQRLSYVMLCLASFATIATSPPAPPPTIYDLFVYEDIIYANFEYYSTDGGKTWREVDFELPSQVTDQAGKYPELPFILCLPEKPNICYQTGEEVILESKDSGATWNINWNIPVGREKYLRRDSAYSNLGPFDIAYLELDGKQILIAAAGTEGVLIKVDNGLWESIGVDDIGPMRFSASNFEEARNIMASEFYVLCFTTFVFLYINVIANTKKRGFLASKLLLILPILSIFLALFGISLINLLIEVVGLILFVLVLLTIFLIFEELFTNTIRQAKINLLMIGIIAFTSYTLFILWAYGIIPVYETAQLIAIGLHLFLLLWIIYQPIKKIFGQNETLPE